ncbi:MAG: L-threonylcarbamoyladenylate synthase [Pseudomonadota bacterium]|nr:L-threonylcarbamoyladenylate synthase [Pseudomonadota bacterium]
MTQFFSIHAENPQRRLLSQAVEIIRDGGVIVYPTDSCYALGCHIGDKDAMERIRRIRGFDKNHHFTLVCRNLNEIAVYAKVDNTVYRLIKTMTPGPYTFLLPATRDVPRRLQNPKRKIIGIRVPDHPVAQGLLELLDEPLMSCTLMLPGDELPLTDPVDIQERLNKQVDLILDGGNCGFEPTSVIDFSTGVPEVIREGKGDCSMLSV